MKHLSPIHLKHLFWCVSAQTHNTASQMVRYVRQLHTVQQTRGANAEVVGFRGGLRLINDQWRSLQFIRNVFGKHSVHRKPFMLFIYIDQNVETPLRCRYSHKEMRRYGGEEKWETTKR